MERWLPRGVGPAWASASRVAVGEKSALFEAIRSNYVDTTDMALNAVTPDASRPAGGPDRIHGVGARGGALNCKYDAKYFRNDFRIYINA